MEQNGAYRHLYDSQMVLENYGKEGMHDEREEKYSKTQKRLRIMEADRLVKPLLHIMMAAIILGTMGYFMCDL